MRFSEAFGISFQEKDDWFNPLLDVDTRLFIDPFRIFADPTRYWSGAHSRLLEFFNLALSLVAKSGFKPMSQHWQAAERLLLFPEPSEFCLGYAQASTKGAGSGRGLQQGMLEGSVAAIRLGLESLDHFEELTLFEAGIGTDRISDMVGNVLKREFIRYTRATLRGRVEMTPVKVAHASWSAKHVRWEDATVDLPMNLTNGKAVLLTPERFLRELPSVDPAEFWEWAWTNENEMLRQELNYEIARNVDAETIASLARRHPDLARRYVSEVEKDPKPPYDTHLDPAGEVHWYENGAAFASRIPLTVLPERRAEFCDFVRNIVDAFRTNVEKQDGWMLLWHEDKSLAERIVQALFRSTVIHYCRANDVDLTGESNAGRGPVDFKFSQGWEARTLVEVKLANNTKFWHGLQTQTPIYMKAEEVHCAIFLSVGFRDADFDVERRQLVTKAARSVSKRTGLKITPVFVDARKKASASKA